MDFNIVISFVGVLISVLSFSIVLKKNNNNDGYFVGKVETKLDTIEKKLDELCQKYDKLDREVEDKIEDKIKQHVELYHIGRDGG